MEPNRIPIYCPDCEAAHLPKRLLMYVGTDAKGTIYPYCKGCKENKTIVLK